MHTDEESMDQNIDVDRPSKGRTRDPNGQCKDRTGQSVCVCVCVCACTDVVLSFYRPFSWVQISVE